MVRNYYLILNINHDASADKIKKAFRHLAKKYHPDLNHGSKFFEEKFKQIVQAYEVLSNPTKRKEYDRQRRAPTGQTVQRTEQPASKPSGARSKAAQKQRKTWHQMPKTRKWPTPRMGEDVVQEIVVPFELTARGRQDAGVGQYGLSMHTLPGLRRQRPLSVRLCKVCKGTGQAPSNKNVFNIRPHCTKCNGRGSIIKEPCPKCKSEGVTYHKQWVTVDIPSGIDGGSRIRLKGLGRAGANLGPRGNLILVVRTKPDPRFRRIGNNVESTVWIDMITASLGGIITVATLDGFHRLTILPGTRSGARFCLRGKGIRDAEGNCGNHQIVIGIKTPKQLTEKQKNLLRELRRSFFVLQNKID